MSLHKHYEPFRDGQELKFSISFSKETRNWATGQAIKQGYRLHVVPVKRTKHNNFIIEQYGCFTGFGTTILEVNRQSSKRLREAIRIMNERKEEFMQYFSAK